MTASQIIFYIISAFTLGTGLFAVTANKIFRSAIWLRKWGHNTLETVHLENMPLDAPVLLLTNCDSFPAALDLIAAVDRYARVILAEDPSRFSIACHQFGPITLPPKLDREKSVFSESTSLLFKNTKVVRMFDAKRNTLIYVAISKRVIEGSPMNAISAVPIIPWTAR